MFRIALLLAFTCSFVHGADVDPPPPPLAKRVESLEARMNQVEQRLGIQVPTITTTSIQPTVTYSQPNVIYSQAIPTVYTNSTTSSQTCTGPNCGQATQWQPFGGLFRRK